MENLKYFKELEIILSSFECDKNCPYCTAKITNWETRVDDIHLLSLYVGQLKELGYKFRYVTIGGNGEPTLHSYNKLKEIVEIFDDYDEIEIKRVLTSGNIFRSYEKEKYELFKTHNWMFEVTTTSINNLLDRNTLHYNHNYFESEEFKQARIRLNYVLLKRNINTFISEIQEFMDKYPNIETYSLKLLNLNTKTGLVDNSLSEWIYENAILKEKREIIKKILDENFEYLGESFDTFSWKTRNGKEVYFSWKKSKYGLYDVVWYGNKFVNYQLEEQTNQFSFVPKVYIASRFMKKKKLDGSLDLSEDFRSKIIGDVNLFKDFNNHTFIYDRTGNLKYQFVGPFYNERASDGSLTNSICDEVVNTESYIIDKCDIFMVYLDEKISPGSISELIYASFKKKKIIIYYKKEENIDYSLKTSNWYPIIQSKQLVGDDNIIIKSVNNEIDIIENIIGENYDI